MATPRRSQQARSTSSSEIRPTATRAATPIAQHPTEPGASPVPGSVLSSLEQRIESLELNLGEHDRRIRAMEDRFDTLNTPRWRRLLFRLDGWGPWHTLREHPRWRPWRRWWTS